MGYEFLSAALTALLVTSTPAPVTLHTQQSTLPPQPEPIVYTVVSGDSLSSIAKKFYGDTVYWQIIWQDNSTLENPHVIYKGMQLTLRPSHPTMADIQLSDTLKERLVKLNDQKSPATQRIAMADVKIEQSTPQTTLLQARPSNFDDVYKAAGETYGVPWEILYGLHLTESGLSGNSGITNKQGSGATGPMQFMPGTWRAYGVDGNGDGTADITNATDAIYGAANFLKKHGSLEKGLKSYGGNTTGVKRAAIARGWDPADTF